jgi:hypothetical protein
MSADEMPLTIEEKAILKETRDDYKKTFLTTKHGRRVLRDIMDLGGLFATAPEHGGAVALARFEGRRDIAQKILACLNKDSYAGLYELEQQGANLSKIFEER